MSQDNNKRVVHHKKPFDQRTPNSLDADISKYRKQGIDVGYLIEERERQNQERAAAREAEKVDTDYSALSDTAFRTKYCRTKKQGSIPPDMQAEYDARKAKVQANKKSSKDLSYSGFEKRYYKAKSKGELTQELIDEKARRDSSEKNSEIKENKSTPVKKTFKPKIKTATVLKEPRKTTVKNTDKPITKKRITKKIKKINYDELTDKKGMITSVRFVKKPAPTVTPKPVIKPVKKVKKKAKTIFLNVTIKQTNTIDSDFYNTIYVNGKVLIKNHINTTKIEVFFGGALLAIHGILTEERVPAESTIQIYTTKLDRWVKPNTFASSLYDYQVTKISKIPDKLKIDTDGKAFFFMEKERYDLIAKRNKFTIPPETLVLIKTQNKR